MQNRTIHAGLAAATVLAGSAAHAEAVELTFFAWVGNNNAVVSKEIIAAYTEAHPDVKIDLLESNNTLTYPKMLAARQVDPENPLVGCGFFNQSTMARGDVDGMWQSMDESAIPNMAQVRDGYIRDGNRGAAIGTSVLGLLYNTEAVDTPPTSWSALWNDDYEGRVVMFDYDAEVMTLTATLNGGGIDNIQPGMDVWAEHAGNFHSLVTSVDAIKNPMSSGEAWLSPWYSNIAHVWIEQDGAPLAFVIPEEGAVAFPQYLAIVDGLDDAQTQVCNDLVNMHLDPENAQRFADLTGAMPVYRGADAAADADLPATVNPAALNGAMMFDAVEMAPKIPEWRKMWDRQVKINLR